MNKNQPAPAQDEREASRSVKPIIRALNASVAVGSDGDWVSIRREHRDAAVRMLSDLDADFRHVYQAYAEAQKRANRPAQDEQESPSVVGYLRKWAFDKEVPQKEKNDNGRWAWPKKFILKPITTGKCLPDDVALMTVAQHEHIVAALTRPAQAEQQPIRMPERKRTEHLPKEYKTMTVVRAGLEAYNRALDDVAALNAAPITQTEQQPEQDDSLNMEPEGANAYLVVDPEDNYHICYVVRSKGQALQHATDGLLAFGPITQGNDS